MIRKINILNFRNWGDEHWLNGVELGQWTVGLGRNSAGKTSILQPLRLLKQTVEALDPGTQLLLKPDVGDGVDCGAFSEVIHGHDTTLPLGIGLALVDPPCAVRVQFKLDGERPIVSRLKYDVASGDATLHGSVGTGQGPSRAIDFPEGALRALDPALAPPVRQAMADVRKTLASFHFLGPSRPPPARSVTWSQQDPTRLGSSGSETIQALIGNETGKNKGALKTAVSTWLKRLDLADSIEISRVGKTLLYQVDVIRGETRSNLADVGFGVSQVLPVIVLLHFVPEGSVILCEDPEAHLHPMAQAVLADMFVEVAKQRNLQILLETHSEHLFCRLQFLIAAEKISNKDCALYYVEREEPSAKVTRLDVDKFGRIANWPAQFFGDAIGETERQMRKYIERNIAESRGVSRG